MHDASASAQAGHNIKRNTGAPLDPAWFEGVGVNLSAVERRTAGVPRRAVRSRRNIRRPGWSKPSPAST